MEWLYTKIVETIAFLAGSKVLVQGAGHPVIFNFRDVFSESFFE